MEHEELATNRGRGSRKKTGGNTRRLWSNIEEMHLMDTLKDLVNRGWKSENGFRTGYLNKLEDALKEKFPGTDLQIYPNITSKLTNWRKTYASLQTAYDTSGVGFNSTTNMVEYTHEQWEKIVQKEPTMHGMRYKQWPLWNDWLEVFGKDRATGEVAEEVLVAANVTRNQYVGQKAPPTPEFNEQQSVKENGTDNPLTSQKNINEEQIADNTAYTTKTNPPSTTLGKKRKKMRVDNDSQMVEILGNYCLTTGDRLDKIASRIGYDHDLGIKRNQVFELLASVPGLSVLDRLEISEYIGARVECIEMFMTLTDDPRAIYAGSILTRARAK